MKNKLPEERAEELLAPYLKEEVGNWTAALFRALVDLMQAAKAKRLDAIQIVEDAAAEAEHLYARRRVAARGEPRSLNEALRRKLKPIKLGLHQGGKEVGKNNK